MHSMATAGGAASNTWFRVKGHTSGKRHETCRNIVTISVGTVSTGMSFIKRHLVTIPSSCVRVQSRWHRSMQPRAINSRAADVIPVQVANKQSNKITSVFRYCWKRLSSLPLCC